LYFGSTINLKLKKRAGCRGTRKRRNRCQVALRVAYQSWPRYAAVLLSAAIAAVGLAVFPSHNACSLAAGKYAGGMRSIEARGVSHGTYKV